MFKNIMWLERKPKKFYKDQSLLAWAIFNTFLFQLYTP